MYPNMKIKTVMVEGKEIQTCGEGYIVNRDEWTQGFVEAQAKAEGLSLTEEHWDVVRFLRAYYEEHGVQAEVRKMVKYFKIKWDEERGSSLYLHRIFPRGGPQKQGNRLAGLLRTKGEH
ncbi:MAG: TusE/DsrC/DsvC family sulfur relay protein [Gammaproteobacteria bacterium]|nr:TusE/DsrC/DsvC family sulfur relay protein [Gammaproteobacteria bacterium]